MNIKRLKQIIEYIYIRLFKLHKSRGIYIYKPTMYYIDKSAKININNKFLFNSQWDNIRKIKNIIPGQLYIGEGSELNVDTFNVFAGSRVTINNNAKLSLGTGYINHNCVIECFNSITIKNNVKISEGVTIRDSDNHTILREGYKKDGPIVIEDDVWIGLNCTILKGVTIGKGCIIAAGTLVNKDCPPYTLIAGVPGKVIKENIKYV